MSEHPHRPDAAEIIAAALGTATDPRVQEEDSDNRTAPDPPPAR